MQHGEGRAPLTWRRKLGDAYLIVRELEAGAFSIGEYFSFTEANITVENGDGVAPLTSHQGTNFERIQQKARYFQAQLPNYGLKHLQITAVAENGLAMDLGLAGFNYGSCRFSQKLRFSSRPSLAPQLSSSGALCCIPFRPASTFQWI